MQSLELNEDVVILDTETTGLQVDTAEICEIAIVDYDGNQIFNSLVKPVKPIPEEATAIHGITNEMVASAPSFADINDRLIDVLKGKTVIVYNKMYDCKILYYTAKRAGVDVKFYEDLDYNNSKCAMLWYSNIRKEPGKFNGQYKWHKLTEACKYEKVDISNMQAHRAYADCMMTLYLIDAVNTRLLTSWEPNDLFIADTSATPVEVVKPKEIVLLPIEQKLKYTPAVINFDVKYYSDWATNITAKYHNLVVTEDMLTQIKKETAELNKFKDELNRSRIDIATKIKEPVTIFEDEVKGVIAIVDKAITNLKIQTDTFEAKRKSEAKIVVAKLLADLVSKSGLELKYQTQVIINRSF